MALKTNRLLIWVGLPLSGCLLIGMIHALLSHHQQPHLLVAHPKVYDNASTDTTSESLDNIAA